MVKNVRRRFKESLPLQLKLKQQCRERNSQRNQRHSNPRRRGNTTRSVLRRRRRKVLRRPTIPRETIRTDARPLRARTRSRTVHDRTRQTRRPVGVRRRARVRRQALRRDHERLVHHRLHHRGRVRRLRRGRVRDCREPGGRSAVRHVDDQRHGRRLVAPEERRVPRQVLREEDARVVRHLREGVRGWEERRAVCRRLCMSYHHDMSSD